MHNAGARKKAPSSPTRVKLSLCRDSTNLSRFVTLLCPLIITSSRHNKTQRKNTPKSSPSLLPSLPPSLPPPGTQTKMKTKKPPERERERERKKERKITKQNLRTHERIQAPCFGPVKFFVN
jgi:hypothetical protein